MRQETADICIAGAGMAGLCAAVAALEAGATVLVIEKGSRSGGSMWLSHGLIWTFTDKAQLRHEVPDGNKALQDIVVDRLTDSHDWLQKRGIDLEPEMEFQSFGRGRMASPAQMAPALVKRVAELGGRILFQTGLQTLLSTNGDVTGIVAFDEHGMVEITAGSVILATGGFQGNAELVSRYITPHADRMYLRANPWSTGDGFLAATENGGAVTPHMDKFYGHALPAPPARFNQFEFLNVTQRYGPMAVALNLNGKRFVDESAGTGEEALNLAIATQPQATAIYIVDAAIADTPGPLGILSKVAIERARDSGAPVIEAPTLALLAKELQAWGVPPDVALHSLQEYNSAVRSDAFGGLLPPRSKNAWPIKVAPFTAMAMRAGITFTCGGLQTDLDMRVLRRAATTSNLSLVRADMSELRFTAMPNLYAAGCDVGGISTGGYIGGLATALVTGRIAGQAAANNARRR
jgi:succinate dehydrogenase/fumarate reductase flavoprotein subunit